MARTLFVCCIAVVAVACAKAGGGGGGDNPDASVADAMTFPGFADANNNGVPDAPTFGQIDAPPMSMIDAMPQQGPIDALPPGSNLFCSDHSDCTNAGECCFTFGQPPGFCVLGTEIGPLCLPQ